MLKPMLEAPIEAADSRAHEQARADQRVVGRPLDQDVVAGADERGDRDEVRARAAVGGDDAVGGDAVVLGEAVDQRPIAVVVLRREVDRLTRAGQVLERAVEQIAAGEIDRRPAAASSPRADTAPAALSSIRCSVA